MKFKEIPGLFIFISALWIIMFSISTTHAANEIRVLSTGIGLEDRIHHDDYSLKLTFALRKGSYLADVNVIIYKGNVQKVVETISKGPWLFVELPAGEYSVVAKRKECALQSAKFSITGKKQTTVILSWEGS